MFAILGLVLAVLVVIGLVFLVLRSGRQEGRPGQSSEPAMHKQQSERARVTGARASGGED